MRYGQLLNSGKFLKKHVLIRTIKALTLLLTSLALSLVFFTGLISGVEAVQLGDDEDGTLGLVQEPAEDGEGLQNEELSKDELSMQELFGDDQVFPFVAGLDSY